MAHRSLDAGLVLNETLESLLDLIEADSGAIWLRQNGHLALQAASGVSDAFLEEERIQSLDACLVGEPTKSSGATVTLKFL